MPVLPVVTCPKDDEVSLLTNPTALRQHDNDEESTVPIVVDLTGPEPVVDLTLPPFTQPEPVIVPDLAASVLQSPTIQPRTSKSSKRSARFTICFD